MLKILRSVIYCPQPLLPIQHIRCVQTNRNFTTNNGPVNEKQILEKLRRKFPSATSINVEDTSGGCGAMFNVSVETSEFKGLSVAKQHRIVYDALKDEISRIHGLHLETKTK
ncbi:bolA-like protein 3 [Diorhabda carinulata]|uniref:bolA-like protein 3 n=1 Tax=Diorhabda carinulata TaxID=1163345 RepID=UPI00259FFD46|nr:bolA-like protein 3 [Diorhabda carinulata]